MTPRISWKMIKKKNARQCIRWPEKGSLLAASLFKTIFVPLIFHREKNETAIEFNDLNRHEPLLPALEFNNAFSKKRKKKKKEEKNTESNFKELGNGKVIWIERATLDYRWQVSNVYTETKRYYTCNGGVIWGLKKIPFDWRVSSREGWSPVSPLGLIIID